MESTPLPAQQQPLEASAVDLASSPGRSFTLTARVATTQQSATIAAKAYSQGLWRPGTSGGQGKLLFLRGGRVCYDIGWVGVIEGSTPVNDGNEHEVGVAWDGAQQRFHILVDGQQDTARVDGLNAPRVQDAAPNASMVEDAPETRLLLGVAVGHHLRGDVANGDMSAAMQGTIDGLTYNGRPVLLAFSAPLLADKGAAEEKNVCTREEDCVDVRLLSVGGDPVCSPMRLAESLTLRELLPRIPTDRVRWPELLLGQQSLQDLSLRLCDLPPPLDFTVVWRPMVEPRAVDLTSTPGCSFTLTARLRTTQESATIAAKAFTNGLWRPGLQGGQGKLLFLRGGRVCFDIGWVGVVEGATAVNDGEEHEVGVAWDGARFRILVDGQRDAMQYDGLDCAAVPDDPGTSFVLGIAVGHQMLDAEVTNGDMSATMRGSITALAYNGQPVNLTGLAF